MTEQTRRRKLATTTEAGRQLLAQRREELAQEEAVASEALVSEAKHRLTMQQDIASTFDEKMQRDVAVQRSIVKRVAASLGSENVVPLFDVVPASQMQAWTDFEQIVVRYVSHDDIPLLAATLRGLLYHEGGHIRWTIPFPDLMNLVQQNPGTLTGVEMNELHHAWNALEDQRMETAVTSDAPRKAAFFTPMVMTEMVYSPEMACGNWPLLIWRRYLPKHIRDGARKLFVSVNSESLAAQMEEVVERYVKATAPADMWRAVLDFASLLNQAKHMPNPGQTARDHQNQPGRGYGKPQPTEIPIDPKQDADKADEQQGAGAGDEAKGEEAGEGAGKGDESKGETEGAGKGAGKGETEAQGGDEADGAGKGQGQGGKDQGQVGEGADDAKGGASAGTSGSHGDDDSGLTQSDINETIAQAEEERLNDSTVQSDVDAFHDSTESTASEMAPYITSRWDDADKAVADAEHLAEDIAQSFNAATMDRQPGWVEGQRQGILDVGRYMFREPSEMDIFRQWIDDDQPGQNLAVSVLLDYSGSMMASAQQLAQVGYACKLACQSLDIPCTVLLWDTGAKTMYDANEVADSGMPVIHPVGGTMPDVALADLDNHRQGKERHLVIIMTDGAWGWGSDRTLAAYGERRYLFGVGYNRSKSFADSYAQMLRGYGCNDAIGCTDLFELPRALELLVIDMA